MDLMTILQERYSVRSFSDKEIEQEKLEKILEAGRIAPTAANFQPQRIYVIKSKEALSKVRSVTRNAFNSPIVLMVCYDKSVSWKGDRAGDIGYDAGEMDACIVTTQMMLQAQELGIGSLWARGYCTENLIKAFDIPENIVPVCLLDLGYPAEACKPSPAHTQRKPLCETVEEL